MNKHTVIFDRAIPIGCRRHRFRASIPGERHIRETASNLAEFERLELFRLYPDTSDETIIRESVAASQYAYQIHVDSVPCGICGVGKPIGGKALIWYLPTEATARHCRRFMVPFARCLVMLFTLLQPEVETYVNRFTRQNLQSLCWLKRFAALQPSKDGAFFILEINVKGTQPCV